MTPVEERRHMAMQRWRMVGDHAARVVAGLFLPEDDPDWNPDAVLTKRDCSMRTWVSLEIMKQEQANAREREVTGRELGKVVLQATLDETQWEDAAKRYAKMREDKDADKQVIDVVEVVPDE